MSRTWESRRIRHNDAGSTLPLILGFFLVALIMVGAGVAATDAFIQQRDLQDVCDGASTAAAASAVRLGRGQDLADVPALQFSAVTGVIRSYLDRDPGRAAVHFRVRFGAARRTVTVRCEQRESVAFGTIFGFSDGVDHIVTSTSSAVLG